MASLWQPAIMAGLEYLNWNNNQDSARSVTNNLNNGYAAAGEQITGQLQPWADAGLQAMNTYQDKLGNAPQPFSFDPTALDTNPDYQWRVGQGSQAVERAASARGLNLSTNVLKDLNKYVAGEATTGLRDDYTRQLGTWTANNNLYQQGLQNLSPLMEQGYGAASGIATGLGNLAVSSGEANATRELLQTMNSRGLINDATGIATSVVGGGNGGGNGYGDLIKGVADLFGGGGDSAFMDDLSNLFSGSLFDTSTWGDWNIGTSFWDGVGALADFFQ